MAIAVISDAPNVGAEQFQAVQQQLNLTANPPQGGLALLAGPWAGNWRVLNVWESQEAWETFLRDRLEPAFQQLGFPIPAFQIWPLAALMLSPNQP